MRNIEIRKSFGLVLAAGLLLTPLAAQSKNVSNSPSSSAELARRANPVERRDMSKLAIELPLKKLLKGTLAVPPPPVISMPPKVAAPSLKSAPWRDMTKSFIESPASSVIEGSVPMPSAKLSANNPPLPLITRSAKRATLPIPVPPVIGISDEQNIEPSTAQDKPEIVKAGFVNWHDDFNAALAASRISHKPVILFQMMGRLDHKFC